MHDNGIYDVQVVSVRGFDRPLPSLKQNNQLERTSIKSSSVAAAAVAAHETGMLCNMRELMDHSKCFGLGACSFIFLKWVTWIFWLESY